MKQLIGIAFCLALLATNAFAGTEVNMSLADKQKLETFCSTFSEVWMERFPKGGLTDEMMLEFAKIVAPQEGLEEQENFILIPLERIDETTEKYFGKRISANRKNDYRVPLAGGEAWRFSQVDKLEQVGDNLFFATGTIFITGSGSTLDPHATPAEWEKEDEWADKVGTFTALIRKTRQDGENRYALLAYTPPQSPK